MEWQAAPVSAPPAVLSSETTPKAAASVPTTGDEAPAAAPTAEAPPVDLWHDPRDEDQTPPSNASDGDDDDGACGVCGSKHSEEEDALIFCDGCDVAVHQLCYNISDETAASDAQWFCEACQELREGKRDARPLTCVICESGRPNGTQFYRDVPLAFKRATSLPRAYARERLVNDPHGQWRDCWAHVACAAWVPEAGFVDENRQIAALCGDLSEVRSKGKCDFCGERGQIVQCARKRCAASFHPACILRELMGPREWSRRFDEGHPGAFVRYAGCAESVGEVICGKHCGVTDDNKAPTTAAVKSDYELQRDARIAQNQAFLASLGLGSTQSPQKSPTRRKRRRGPAQPAARKSARECAQAVQPGQYAPPPQRRSEAEIEEEREERAAERLAKFLKRADKAAAGAAAADAREYLRFARFLSERSVDAAAAALLYERWAREGPAFFARFREEEKLRKQRARADEQARRRAEKEAALLRKDADRAARVADKCGADNAIRAARALLKELRKTTKKKSRRAPPEPVADEGDLYARPYKKRKKRHVPTPNVRLRVVSNATGTVSEDMPRFVNVKCGASVARAMLPDKLWPGRFAPRPRSYAYVAVPPSVQPARRGPSLPMDVLGFTGLG